MLGAYERGVMIRITGDTIAMSPPLTVGKGDIDTAIEGVRGTLRALA